MTESPLVGRVVGLVPATPLEFWVAVREDQFLQLDDVVALERRLPKRPGETEEQRQAIHIYGVVSDIRAAHDGVIFGRDVFDDARFTKISETAQILATRFEPEVFVPPHPGTEVRKATGKERDQALFFDRMERTLAAGLTRDGEPIYLNLDFIDGTRGAHINISGVSGVATKTSYAMFLLYSLFHSTALGDTAHNAKALVFNVKGEDLLFLDRPNIARPPHEADRYAALGLQPAAFESVTVLAPPKKGAQSAVPDVAGRAHGVDAVFWTIVEFCQDELLQFLFADQEDDRQQYPIVVSNVMARLKAAVQPLGSDGAAMIEDTEVRTFRQLVELIGTRVENDQNGWAGVAIGTGTINAFRRRLGSAVKYVEHLVRGDIAGANERSRKAFQDRITVVDLHNLHDRAQRFVVGVMVREMFDKKESDGRAENKWFLVLDELNKYAPRTGSSPIKEVLLDIAERGRSLGMILIGCQQTASEVERRIVSNSSIRVVGRLDAAEAGRDEYGFLPLTQRQRSTLIKPGTMIVAQPELPVPLVVEFPFPSWATRRSEAGPMIYPTVDPFAAYDK